MENNPVRAGVVKKAWQYESSGAGSGRWPTEGREKTVNNEEKQVHVPSFPLVFHDPKLDVTVWRGLTAKRFGDLQLEVLNNTACKGTGTCNKVPDQGAPEHTGITAIVTNTGEGPMSNISAPLYRHLFGSALLGYPMDFGDPPNIKLLNPGESQEVKYYEWAPTSRVVIGGIAYPFYLDVVVPPPPAAQQQEINKDNNDSQRQIPELDLEGLIINK